MFICAPLLSRLLFSLLIPAPSPAAWLTGPRTVVSRRKACPHDGRPSLRGGGNVHKNPCGRTFLNIFMHFLKSVRSHYGPFEFSPLNSAGSVGAQTVSRELCSSSGSDFRRIWESLFCIHVPRISFQPNSPPLLVSPRNHWRSTRVAGVLDTYNVLHRFVRAYPPG